MMLLARNCSTALTQTLVASSAATFLAGTVLTFALGVTAATLPAQSSEIGSGDAIRPAKLLRVNQLRTLRDGTYLYGQATKAEQIGKTYLVLQVRDRAVTGAIYEPASSFDCVQGIVQSNQLALTITDSYEQTQSPYSIALQANSRIASTIPSSLERVGLAGYYQIQSVSANDRRLLSTCEAKNTTAI